MAVGGSPGGGVVPVPSTHSLLPAGAAPPIALVGTTASGKSALALGLARARGDVDLVSVDSMQVYRGMDIGTAKPTKAEQAEVRHHLIDLVDPWEPFEVHSFQRAAREALADIAARGRHAVLVGGTGLYLRAVIDGFEIPGRYPDVLAALEAEAPDGDDAAVAALHGRLSHLDPPAAARMEPNNRRRVLRALEVTLGSGRPFSSYGPGVDSYPSTPVQLVGVPLAAEVVAARIEARYHQQLADGFLAELAALAAGPPLSRTAVQALGYRELLPLVHDGTAPEQVDPSALAEALDLAVRRTRTFARRQRAWFRRDPRVRWLEPPIVEQPTSALPALVELAERTWGPSTVGARTDHGS